MTINTSFLLQTLRFFYLGMPGLPELEGPLRLRTHHTDRRKTPNLCCGSARAGVPYGPQAAPPNLDDEPQKEEITRNIHEFFRLP